MSNTAVSEVNASINCGVSEINALLADMSRPYAVVTGNIIRSLLNKMLDIEKTTGYKPYTVRTAGPLLRSSRLHVV
jgi:putative cofactor-binding repeat protein